MPDAVLYTVDIIRTEAKHNTLSTYMYRYFMQWNHSQRLTSI